MPSASRARWLVPLLVGLVVVIIDQLTKAWVLRTLGPVPLTVQIPLVGDWLSLIYLRNTGVAFGLFQDIPQFFTFTALLICAASIYAYCVYLPNRSRWMQVSLGLVLGGALGNILDRVRYSYVVDFIRIGWWPVFNAADSAICVGVAIIAIYMLINERAPAPHTPPRDDTLLQSLLNQEHWSADQRHDQS